MAMSRSSIVLREGLLEGRSVLLAAAGAGERTVPAAGALAEAVGEACTNLGAQVLGISALSDQDGISPAGEQAVEERIRMLLEPFGAIDAAIIDAAGMFAAASSPGQGDTPELAAARAALSCALAGSWNVTRAVANLAFMAGDHGGRVVLLAPAPGAGLHADAARAGLENLARTLSTEWARHRITAVAVAPGDATEPAVVATVAAFLASTAGAYFSGCLLDLRGPRAPW
jgi:NAD(P)-dependent dehydrogenase (short-subunit alcohol dehydrogenase family)